MTQYVCDRCGEKRELKYTEIAIPRPDLGFNPFGVDLCDRCLNSLLEFLQPLPKVKRNDND